MKEIENTTYQNLWDAVKAEPREKNCSCKHLYFKRKKDLNNLDFHLKN